MINNKEIPSFYAIIPAPVRYDKDLISNAKLLYGEITALTKWQGYCWATNEYFAKLYNTSDKTITRWIKNLTDKGYISTEVKTFRYDDGTVKKIRYIYLDKNVLNQADNNSINHMDKNVLNHMDKNVPYINTISNNTVSNNILKDEEYYEKIREIFDYDWINEKEVS